MYSYDYTSTSIGYSVIYCRVWCKYGENTNRYVTFFIKKNY